MLERVPNQSLSGPALLANALAKAAEPDLILCFYPFGLIMRRKTEAGMVEYPVDPLQVATALAAKVTFSTGILSGGTICVINEGVRRIVVEYRAPQRTAIFVEGSEHPIRSPLPGLLLLRSTRSDDSPHYKIFAV